MTGAPQREQPTLAQRPRPPLPPGPYVVVGLARSGRAAALALAQRGEQVIGLDAGAPDGLEELAASGVEVHADAQATALPPSARALVKSPGVPPQAPAIADCSAIRILAFVVHGIVSVGLNAVEFVNEV